MQIKYDFLSLLIFVFLAIIYSPVADANDFLAHIEQALQSDPEFANKQSEVREADAALTAATAQFLPDLTVSATQSQLGDHFFKQPTKYQNYLVNSQWNIFKFGADWSHRNSVRANLASKTAALEEYRIQFESEFSEKLFTYLSVSKLLQIKNEQLISQKRLLEIAQQRYQRGYLARQEVDKMSIDLDFIDNEIIDLKNRLSLLNSEVRKRLPHLSESLDWPWIGRFEKFAIAPMNLEEHPSYLVRFESFQASDEDYSRASRQFWGSLDLNLQWMRTNQINDEFSNQSATYLTLTIPLFNRMKDWSSRRYAFEKMTQSENRLRQSKEDLLASFQKSSEIFENHRQNFHKRATTLKTSRSLLSDNRARFQQGRISANELSIDQNRVYQAEQVAVNSLLQVHVALKNLCIASGKNLKECLK